MVLGDSYCIFENSGSTKGRQWEKNLCTRKGNIIQQTMNTRSHYLGEQKDRKPFIDARIKSFMLFCRLR